MATKVLMVFSDRTCSFFRSEVSNLYSLRAISTVWMPSKGQLKQN